MFSMQNRIRRMSLRMLLCLAALPAFAPPASAAGLSLDEAVGLALREDPALLQIEARGRALDELSVAAGQWPDPMLKMGLVSLPTDTFRLGQEPMTQVQLGVSQKFPRGDSRALRSRQLGLRSDGLDARSRDEALQIRLGVREQYIEVLKQQHLSRINAEAVAAFSEVADLTRDYYASGRVQQQDVLQAAVEVARAEDRAARIGQEEAQARARLAAWIGDAAYTAFETSWPVIEVEERPDVLKAGLAAHPRIEALEIDAVAADTGVELARQRYKPEFGVDLTYGGRGGRNADGTPRTDLFTVMVVMDVPLFTANRQDRLVSARAAESAAALYQRDDALRRLRSEVDAHTAVLQRQKERLKRYEATLLPEAEFSSEASMNAFRSSLTDLTTLLRTRLTEFELQLDYIRLRSEALKSEARLAYLEGAES